MLSHRAESILSMQANGLKARLAHTKAKKAVVGVSGGLDSTLALLVIARTFDMLGKSRADILAVTMPGFGTTARTKNQAITLVKALGGELREIPIDKAVLVHFADIGQRADEYDVTYENAQARERTQILMDLANKTGGIVVGSGDLSELALGFSTYNGDHMSMYGVNAGVPKTLVKYLVAYEAERLGGEAAKTLRGVLDTEISPELLPPDKAGKIAQKTEEIVGPYELHDFFLYHAIRWGCPPDKAVFLAELAFASVYPKEEIAARAKTFFTRFFAQQFKRSCLPDGVKVGSVSLSPRGDWKMPSDASSAAWIQSLT